MSARHIRRKIGDNVLVSAAVESSEEEEVVMTSSKPMNMFDMLGGSDEESQEPEASAEEDEVVSASSASPVVQSSSTQPKPSSNVAKNAKKRNKKKANKAAAVPDSDDELDALLASVPKTSGPTEVDVSAQRDAKLREILRVNSSLLDPDSEMQRLFGADVVPNRGVAQVGPRNNARGGGRHGPGITVRKKTVMIKPRANWAPVGGKSDGMEMVLVEAKRGVNYFKMTWDKSYQKAQESFHRCVETGDPNSLAALMRMHPYHADTLLQLHDAFQMTEEKDAALDLLERLIYRFESSLHPKFSIFAPDAASSIRFLYQEPENRSYMLGILSYIQEIGKKGCSQTALEWSKLLLSLDLSDPLGVLLLIDHFALRRREHVWLLQFYHSPLFQEHDLSILPNFVYSIALSAFYHKRNIETEENKDNQEYADINPTHLMHNAMAMHPSLFVTLIARLSAGSIRTKGQNVLELPHFANATQQVLPLVNVLCHLYIERNHAMWKDPACIQWLKECAISFYLKLAPHGSDSTASSTIDSKTSTVTTSIPTDPNDLTTEEWISKIEAYAVLAQALTENPTRIHRHVILSEFNSVIRMLPSEILREGFHIYEAGEIGAPQASSSASQQGQAPNEQQGAVGQIARILDYLVPFQADTNQVESLLNLIGYRMGGDDDGEGQDDE